MAITFLLLLVMAIASILGLGVDKLLMDTELQLGFVGDKGVEVGSVGMEVFVRVGGIFVAVGGFGVDVGVGERVADGSTSNVFVGSTVMVGMLVRVGLGVRVGVDVI